MILLRYPPTRSTSSIRRTDPTPTAALAGWRCVAPGRAGSAGLVRRGCEMPQRRAPDPPGPGRARARASPSFVATPKYRLSPVRSGRTTAAAHRSSGNRTPGGTAGPSPAADDWSYNATASTTSFNTSRPADTQYHDAVPHSPTEDKSGGGHGLQHTVHAAHARELDAPGRHKTYIIATYTAQLSQEDVDQPWFVTCDENDDQAHARQTLGLRFPPENRTESVEVWGALGSQPRNHGSSSRTDAHIAIRLHGCADESGWRTLAQEGEGISEHHSDVDVFAPGGVDEFAITCTDLGELRSIEVRQEGNGRDQNTSLWKISRIAITTTQHQATDKAAGQSVKTDDNPHWIFIPKPGEEWLGRTPPGVHPLMSKIAAANEEIEELERQIRDKKQQILSWQQVIDGDEERVANLRHTGNTLSMHIDENSLAPQKPQNQGKQPKGANKSTRPSVLNCCGMRTKQKSTSTGVQGTTRQRTLAPRAHRHLSLDKKRVVDHSIGGASTRNALTPQKLQSEPELEAEPEPVLASQSDWLDRP